MVCAILPVQMEKKSTTTQQRMYMYLNTEVIICGIADEGSLQLHPGNLIIDKVKTTHCVCILLKLWQELKGVGGGR